MNELQLFLLMQNQVMVIKHGMTLTAPNKGLGRVKSQFKQMMGLKRNASDAETLQNIGILYAMNGKGKKFNDYMRKQGAEWLNANNIQLVREDSVEEQLAKLN